MPSDYPIPWSLVHSVTAKHVEKAKTLLDNEEYKEYADKLALRAFFNSVRKNPRKTVSAHTDTPVRFTVFLEPYPYLCKYNEGDEDLVEFKPLFFDSFRVARRTFIKLFDLWYKHQRRLRKASELP